MFYKGDEGQFIHFTEHPDERTMKRLPSGVYSFQPAEMMSPAMLLPVQIKEHALAELRTRSYSLIKSAVRRFFYEDTRERAARYSMPHRMGVLLHGPQGTGKTTLIRSLVQEMGKEAGVVTLTRTIPELTQNAIETIREDDPERNIVVVWEEFDQWAQPYEGFIKAMLDGMDSPEHVLFLATTNYLGRIPATLSNRPGRFSFVTEVGYFDAHERREFIALLLDAMNVPDAERATIDVDKVVAATEGRSADDIKHLLLNGLVYGWDMQQSLDQLNEAGEAQMKALRQEVSGGMKAHVRAMPMNPFAESSGG